MLNFLKNAFAVTLLLSIPAAYAARSASVVVLPQVGIANRSTADLEAEFEKQLGKRAVSIKSFGQLPRTMEPAAVKDAAKKARELLKAAEGQIDELSFAEASEKINKALALLEKSDLAESADLLMDLLALKAYVALNSKPVKESEAKAAIAQVLAMKQDYEPDAARWDPSSSKYWDHARAKLQPSTSWEIVSTPAGADLKIDGNRMGTTPISPVGIIPGAHYLEFSIPGHTVVREKYTLVAGKPTEVDLWPPDSTKEAVNHRWALSRVKDSAEKLSTEAGKYAQWTKSSEVYVILLPVVRAGSNLKAYRFDAHGKAVADATVPISGRDAAQYETVVREVLSKLSADIAMGATMDEAKSEAVSLDTEAEVPLDAVAAKKKTYRRIGWGMIGVGGASALIGVSYGISALSKKSSDPQTATRFAHISDILGWPGAALALGGIALVWLNPAPNADTAISWQLMPLPGGAAASLQGTF